MQIAIPSCVVFMDQLLLTILSLRRSGAEKLIQKSLRRDWLTRNIQPLWLLLTWFAGCAQLLVARRPKLGTRFPFRICVGVRDSVADFEKYLEVLNRAGQIPIRQHFVLRLVIPVVRVVLPHFHTVICRFADVVRSGIGIERWNTLFGEVEMIGPIVEALFRLRVRLDGTALLSSRLARVLVKIGIAQPDEHEISGSAVHVHAV